MSFEVDDIGLAVVVGVGATLLMDLWTIVLKRLLNIASLDYCLVGRWLRYMGEGVFKHSSIVATPARPAECTIGWIAHYAIGAVFAVALVLVSPRWLQQPSILPALTFGISTVVVPFFVMQPSLGFGIAASRTANPTQARLRSVMTHTVFGLGLYVMAIALSRLIV